MFVVINNDTKEEITAIVVDTWLRKARNDGFSLEKAMQVLKWSNNYSNIKQVVKEINKLDTVEKRLIYKEFVLGAVNRRETSKESYAMLRALAVEGRYEKEFDELNAKQKIYGIRDCGFKTAMIYHSDFMVEDFSDYDSIIFDCKMSRNFPLHSIKFPKHVCFLQDKELFLHQSFEDIEKLVVLEADKIKISGSLPKEVWFGNCKDIDLSEADLSKVEEMPFVEGTEVTFYKNGYRTKTKFPKVLDLRGVDSINFSDCDLDGCENIIFGKKSKVKFVNSRCEDECKNLSGVLDFSMCDEVNLYGCDLSKVTEIKFKAGATVNLGQVKGLPENTDLSMLGDVSLFNTDLSKIKKLNFGKNCKVKIAKCDLSNLDEITFDEGVVLDISSEAINREIDFSKCKKVHMNKVDASGCKMDFSSCEEVDMRNCELNNSHINFGDDTEVLMFKCNGISDEIDFSKLKKLLLENCDITKGKNIVLAKGANVFLNYCDMPAKIDASDCEVLKIDGCKDDLAKIVYPKNKNVSFDWCILPEKLDLSMLDVVNIPNADFSRNKEIKFKDGAKVYMTKASNLRRVLDFSSLSVVSLEEAILANVREIKFRDGAEVCLRNARDISCRMDLSKVKKLDVFGAYLLGLEELDLSNVEEIKKGIYTSWPRVIRLSKNNNYVCKTLADEYVMFKISKGGDFRFEADTVVPKRLDLSELDVVDFGMANLSNLQECVFKKGARVKLDRAFKYPKILDLSECEDVELDVSKVGEIQKIIFKNKEQRDRIIEKMHFERGLDKFRFKRKCEYGAKLNNNMIMRESERCL